MIVPITMLDHCISHVLQRNGQRLDFRLSQIASSHQVNFDLSRDAHRDQNESQEHRPFAQRQIESAT